jgi:hypothetical protein
LAGLQLVIRVRQSRRSERCHGGWCCFCAFAGWRVP